MRLAHHVIRHSSGTWHFRLRVPAVLQSALGLRVVKRSLQTTCPQAARVRAYTLTVRYAALFVAARDALMPRSPIPSVDRILAEVERGETRRFEYEADPLTGRVLKAKSDGTPQDNADLLAALRLMTAQPVVAVSPAAPPAVKVKAIALGEAAQKYRLTLDPATMPRKTLTQKMAAVNGFATWKGVKAPLSEVTRTDVSEWFLALRGNGLATPTLTNKGSYLTAFFLWAKGAGYYHFDRDDNPGARHVVYLAREKRQRKKLGFRSFTPQELQKIYSPDALARLNDKTRWGAVLGLYLGARVSEVGQIALVDFVDVHGLWCVRITDEGEGQSLKNEVSIREVPVHPDLIRLGLRDRVAALRAAGETRLLPGVQPGAANGLGGWLSSAFGRYLVALGIKVELPPSSRKKGPKVGFHSLRRTAIEHLQAAGMAAEARAQYVGHEIDDEHRAVYSRPLSMPELLHGVGTGPFTTVGVRVLAFEGIDLDAIARVL
ncbi:MAG: integrase [Rudaea sp.]|nr:site-specific integrase [Rudaea sp.]MBN8887999.1 integrase [Rudaea sp.]